ncbi:hypothetical protein EST38_g13876, partial [Candolleomyces aberdarensis]
NDIKAQISTRRSHVPPAAPVNAQKSVLRSSSSLGTAIPITPQVKIIAPKREPQAIPASAVVVPVSVVAELSGASRRTSGSGIKLAYWSEEVKIGRNSDHTFKWWNIQVDGLLVDPESFILLESPTAGDILMYYNPTKHEAGVYQYTVKWINISYDFFKNTGAILHPSFPLTKTGKRVLTWKNATH